MLNKKQLDLIEFLLAQGSASSAVIADRLQVSKRTVISYVREINDFFLGSNLIQASNRGYHLDLDVFSHIQAQHPELTVAGPEDRLLVLAKHFLSGYRDKFNINAVSEEMYYSSSTIRTDIYKIRDMARPYDLDVALSYHSASLVGAEQKKREFYFSFFHDTLERNIYDFSQLMFVFPQIDVAKVSMLLAECLKRHSRSLSDYELTSILYRLIISMDRITHGHLVENTLYLLFVKNEDMILAQDMANQITLRFGVVFPTCEVKHLALLLAAMDIHGGTDEEVTVETLKENLWPSCYEIAEKIIDNIKHIYGMDLRKRPEEYVAFALNIRSLIRRIHAGVQAKNPYRKSVKTENPVAFDCAVYAAMIVGKKYHIKICEDDIAYLALCLGHAFEQEFDESARLKTLFVLPSYYNVHQTLYQYYEESMGSYMYMERTSDLRTYPDLEHIDLIVSTLGLKNLDGKPFLQIGPIRNARDRKRLFQTISNIHYSKMIQNFADTVACITHEQYFYRLKKEEVFASREEALDYLLTPLERAGVIADDFRSALLRREAFSGTALGLVALPRTAEGMGMQDTLSVLISDAPIPWGDSSEVRAVLLLTVKPEHYHSVCLKMIRRLTHIFSQKENVQKVLKCITLKEFVALIAEH